MKKMINFRNIFLLLVASCVMLTTTPVMAQKDSHDDCFVDMPPYNPEPPTTSNLWCYPQSFEYNVRIAFHIVQDVNGMGGTTQEELNQAINILVQDFAPTITFTVIKGEPVKSTTTNNYFEGNAYKLLADGSAPPLFRNLRMEKFVNGALNVYLGPASNVNDGGAASFSQAACTIAGSRVGAAGTPTRYLVTSRAISHEIGHLLGLLHPFSRQTNLVGSPPMPREDINVRPLINGQVCSETGDLICDTPVDPTQTRNNIPNQFDFRPLLVNCVWNNTTQMDPSGQLYNPNTSNIMASTHVDCMTAGFTAGQFRKMYSHCLNDLQDIVDVYQVNWLCGGNGGGGSSTSMKAIVKTEKLKFTVFPNPATEFLSIHFLSDSKETQLQITDIIGKSLYKKNLGRTNKKDVQEIDFNSLPKGIHILTVSNEIDKKTTKIVIQ